MKVLANGLYRLSNGFSYGMTGDAFNVGKTTAFEAFEDVVNKIFSLKDQFIKSPSWRGGEAGNHQWIFRNIEFT